ncbi:DUF4276 family protein [Desulfobotulus mexicanus]|uniref:DUF4276 family protein n=1 Tax=Desulfobotulus mexicanus TaxID=2586642 RepID=A0A5S5MF45_9BACT|nr:DUF4276 family protein [Desulfobotulus mexicanus]TYT74324.1 DUF4276 family protein [Desulfobotulus mexicanus]
MIRVHVFCEGQTEDVFVREVLGPHFQRMNIWLNSIIIRTGPQGKGGLTSYGKVKWQVENKCKEDANAWVTTLLDFYGLPSDFPAMTLKGDSLTRAKIVESAFQADMAQPNFISNILVHEFEGLLFSDPSVFAEWFDDEHIVHSLTRVRNDFATPEHINDGRTTAPSKRILSVCDTYDKVAHGSLIALDIGLETIRRECPLFDAWIKRLEGLNSGGAV